jgi:hypothetical protein
MYSFVVFQSEKKYKTKAAQEYRRHIQKLAAEASGTPIAAIAAEETPKSPQGTGLEHIMKSLSNTTMDAPPISPLPVSVFSVASAAPAAEPDADAPVVQGNPRTITPSYTPVQKGTIDITAAVTPVPTTPDTPADASGAESDSTGGYTSMKPSSSKVLGKKPMPGKKSSATRVMASSDNEVKLESFETMEKRLTTEAKKEAKLQASAGIAANGSSRLDAVYEASIASAAPGVTSPLSPSRYQQQQPTTPKSVASVAPASSRYGNLSGGSSSTSTTDSSSTNKYSGAKSISSDQYFGRDEAEAQQSRARLDKYSGSTSISSDMLNGNEDAYSSQNRNNRDPDASEMVSALKDSVKGFFDDIQRRIGKVLLIYLSYF